MLKQLYKSSIESGSSSDDSEQPSSRDNYDFDETLLTSWLRSLKPIANLAPMKMKWEKI